MASRKSLWGVDLLGTAVIFCSHIVVGRELALQSFPQLAISDYVGNVTGDVLKPVRRCLGAIPVYEMVSVSSRDVYLSG